VVEHLDAVAGRGEMDVIADLAFPLPFTVISEMLGMPEGDRDQLRAWSHAGVRLLDPILSSEQILEAFEAMGHMYDHCAEAIAWKREHPGDDLLTALIHAEEDGDTLSAPELQDQVVLLFLAGHETTVNLIGNGTLALLRHRDQLDVLRDDPGLDVNAIDELLRFDSPVQFSRRIVLRDVEIDGHAIGAGSFVMTCLGAANHDPAQWGPTADELDLRREGAARHLSFGSGIHHCLGAALARLEGQEAIGALVRRFDGLELATDAPAWNGRIVLRGLDELPVRWS
jgi:cytochrome P450